MTMTTTSIPVTPVFPVFPVTPVPRRTARGERGSVTMVMPFLGALLVVVLALAFQGGVLVAQRKVQAAADLAALAGATAAQRGADACAAAATMAARNAARLASCRRDGVGGHEVVVDVEREGPTLWGSTVTVRATARAGPDPPRPGRARR